MTRDVTLDVREPDGNRGRILKCAKNFSAVPECANKLLKLITNTLPKCTRW